MKEKPWGEFCEVFGINPRMRVLEFFLEMQNMDFSAGFVAEDTQLNRATTYNIMEDLVASGIIVPTRKISGAQLYKLNKDKQEVKILIAAFNSVLRKIATEHVKKKVITA